MLGGGVAADFRPGGQGGDGAEQHDIAGAFDQQRQASPGAIKRAVQVAAQRGFPGGRAGLAGTAHAMPTGTRQQYIKAAMVRANLRDKAFPGVRAGRIADQDQATGLGRHLLQRLTTPAHQD